MKKMIIDVDTGVDDAIGIMLASSRKNVELLGIVAVNGNVSLEKAYLNTKRILKFIDREDIKVYKGAAKPLNKAPFNAEGIHGTDGLAGQLLDMEIKNEELDGIKFIIDSIMANYQEVDMVVTGPVTNLALAIKANKNVAKGLKSLTIMTGAFEVEGNVTDFAEFNTYADPDALELVLNSGISDVRLIGLDITKKTLLTPEHIKKINNGKIRDFIYKLTKNYMDRYIKLHKLPGCAMHDPLAVGVALENKFVDYKECHVFVDTTDGERHGSTDIVGYDSPNASVGIGVDSEQFLTYLVESLTDL